MCKFVFGYDSDDDIEDENFWQDLLKRPFFNLWKNEVDKDGQRVYRNRVCVLMLFSLVVYSLFIRRLDCNLD